MSNRVDPRIDAAVGAMERGAHQDAAALLIGLLGGGPSTDQREALVRALLAQTFVQLDELDGALEQARAALAAAQSTADRDTIHRCMALLASVELIREGRL
jgi:thioredoxin-like negative regulator of GroEL